ncbi:MAG TPA: class I SAM-dependent methyltransferase [Thermoanaerobaculia bacterium]|nr:class I SAM-dependent methyltransferase [Thermoanaerobaculia bacterium]
MDLVRRGYDATADTYAAARAAPGPERRWVEGLLALLPGGSRVVDLGCGNGRPVAAALSAAGHRVTGVDFSLGQLARARRLAPDARLVAADLADLAFRAARFDAAVAWDSVFHLPPALQPPLFRRLRGWLAPNAPVLLTLGGEAGEIRADHLGAPTYYGALAPGDALAALAASGLDLLEHAFDQPRHLVVLARAAAPPPATASPP